MFPEHIETERLHLRRFDEYVDLYEYYEICAYDDGIEEATEYVPWEPHSHPKETKEHVDKSREAWDEGRGPSYAIVPKESEDGAGVIAGAGGLRVDWDKQSAELGVFIRKRFWGRGYSGERAAALITIAFDRLDLDLVTVTVYPDNDKSVRAIEKYVDRFGGRREGLLRNFHGDPDGPVDAIRFSISREEFEANRDATGAVTIYD